MCGRCGSILHCSIYANSKSTFRPRFVVISYCLNVLLKGAFIPGILFLDSCGVPYPHEGGTISFVLVLDAFVSQWPHEGASLVHVSCLVSVCQCHW